MRGGRLHAGLDISAPAGTPVRAAAAGVVTYSNDTVRGYGNMVLIDHGNGFVTAYAHNSENLVSPGTRVAAGEVIALVGATGNATGPHVHFEVRRSGRTVNPRPYLGR
jgi:murein DD-endopeptidase MepM/ murein hydrolase activator NlpD